MSQTLAPVAVSAGVTTPITIPGDPGSVTWVRICNASPYLVTLTNLAEGVEALMPGECNVWPTPYGLSSAIQVTPQSFLSTSNSPSSALVVTWYTIGERPAGVYPVNFNLLSYVGNTVPTTTIGSLVNDGNAPGTQIIEATASGFSQSNVLVKNDGSFRLYGNTVAGPSAPGVLLNVALASINQNAEVDVDVLLRATNGLTVVNAATSLDGGLITTDGAGNLTVGGTVKANAPLKLAAGHQETGFWSIEGTATGALTYGSGINFKTTLTNTPSSLTLSSLSSSNVASGPTVPVLTTTGAHVKLTTTAAGDFFWTGTYTTVGNCLLAVDSAAGAFDHHCDICGHITLAAPLASLDASSANALPTLSYLCPSCGAVECFNTAMTAADEADITPQGEGAYTTTRGEQASRIRQLMRLLDLTVK